MALVFSLSAECGTQKEAAEAVAAHFHGLIIALADGNRFPCRAGTFYDAEGWWARICPVSSSGICLEDDASETTEIGFALYERLRSAPPFRFALVGIEVDGFRYFRELDDDVVTCDWNGLVLADAVWQHLGSPPIFVPFEPGYRWRPFTNAR